MTIKQIEFTLLCINIIYGNNMLSMKRRYSDKPTTPYHIYPDHTTENDPQTYEENYHYALYLNVNSLFMDYAPQEYREKYFQHMLKELENNKKEIALRQQK